MTDQKPVVHPVIPCPTCATYTHHTVLHSVERSYGDEDAQYYWDDTHQIVECNGCKTVSFRHLHSNSEDVACDRYGNVGPDVAEELYPRRAMGRKPLSDIYSLPPDVRRIYLETQQALVNEFPVLVGIGIRAIVESVCKDQKAQGTNLERRIDDLVKKQMLTPSGATILHKLRTLGNEAAHEVQPHNSAQLSLAIDVVEHLLEGAYIFPKQAAETLD